VAKTVNQNRYRNCRISLTGSLLSCAWLPESVFSSCVDNNVVTVLKLFIKPNIAEEYSTFTQYSAYVLFQNSCTLENLFKQYSL